MVDVLVQETLMFLTYFESFQIMAVFWWEMFLRNLHTRLLLVIPPIQTMYRPLFQFYGVVVLIRFFKIIYSISLYIYIKRKNNKLNIMIKKRLTFHKKHT